MQRSSVPPLFFLFHPRYFHPILSPFLYPFCVPIHSSSLLPRPSPGHYSVLPLYERLLFKTLRSDLMPTEAIPLAALCIYHGSPILSRLLTLQFSSLPHHLLFFLFSSHSVTPTSHTSAAFFCCLAPKTLATVELLFFSRYITTRQLAGTPFRIPVGEELRSTSHFQR